MATLKGISEGIDKLTKLATATSAPDAVVAAGVGSAEEPRSSTYHAGEAQPLCYNLLSDEAKAQGSYPILPGHALPEKIMKKIRADEYVDFRDIIYKLFLK